VPQPVTAAPVTSPTRTTFDTDAPLDPEAYITGKDAIALADRIVARIQQQAQPTLDTAASAVYGMAALRHAKEFGKYEPEIQTLLARVPKAQWTLDTMDTVVKLVKADHMADYRSEWEQEFVGKMEPTMRSIGNAGSASAPSVDKSQSLESEKIPTDWKLRAQKAGITESTVAEFCRANDMTTEAFFKLFDSGKIVTEGAVA